MNQIDYSKLANTFLEKDGEKKQFITQEQVDQAWEDGWHTCGEPETAIGEEKSLEDMNMTELRKKAKGLEITLVANVTKKDIIALIEEKETTE